MHAADGNEPFSFLLIPLCDALRKSTRKRMHAAEGNEPDYQRNMPVCLSSKNQTMTTRHSSYLLVHKTSEQRKQQQHVFTPIDHISIILRVRD